MLYKYNYTKKTLLYFEIKLRISYLFIIFKNVKNNYFKLIDNQDSSLINMLKIADGILIRKPFSKPIKRKQNAKVLVFNDFVNQKFMT